MTKRIIWSCGILVLGLLTTVGVAWACAAWINPVDAAIQFSMTPLSDGTSEAISARVRFGHTRLDRCRATEKRDEQGALRNVEVIRGRDERSETLAGWPLRALACANPAYVSIISPGRFGNMWSNPAAELTHGIELSPFIPGATVGGPAWRALPYQPLWTGLVMNTLIYSLAWVALLLGPAMLRRWLRRRRGLCERCGYDLRNVAHARCPECGHTVPQRAAIAPHA